MPAGLWRSGRSGLGGTPYFAHNLFVGVKLGDGRLVCVPVDAAASPKCSYQGFIVGVCTFVPLYYEGTRGARGGPADLVGEKCLGSEAGSKVRNRPIFAAIVFDMGKITKKLFFTAARGGREKCLLPDPAPAGACAVAAQAGRRAGYHWQQVVGAEQRPGRVPEWAVGLRLERVR